MTLSKVVSKAILLKEASEIVWNCLKVSAKLFRIPHSNSCLKFSGELLEGKSKKIFIEIVQRATIKVFTELISFEGSFNEQLDAHYKFPHQLTGKLFEIKHLQVRQLKINSDFADFRSN